MTYVLTFVASSLKKPLKNKHLKEAVKILKFYDIEETGDVVWLHKKKAADLPLPTHPGGVLLMHLHDMLRRDEIDLFITPAQNRKKKLLMADMDSTIVTGETLDELAAFAGIKDRISEITARAMEGKIDFEAALRERVGLLKDLPEKALQETLSQTQTSPGAETFVRTMKMQGATCVLVSGGFTYFTAAIAEQAGFDNNHGNTLEIENGRLTGRVIDPVLDKHAKVDFLEHYMQELGLQPADVLAIGDGANDLPMLKKAGLGIGYKPKKTVEDAIENVIRYGDLTAALYAQGYNKKSFS